MSAFNLSPASRTSVTSRHRRYRSARCLLVLLMFLAIGCGKTVQNLATEELVLSDAVDRSLRSMDFSPLAGQKCYIDTAFLPTFKPPYPPTLSPSLIFVGSEYVTSSIRNQLLAAGAEVVAAKDQANVIIEPRIGTLGTDEHETVYGIPANNGISQLSAMVPAGPALPQVPELALAKLHSETGAAKLAVMAYDAKTGTPLWQSGLSIAKSDARDIWLFGIGPYQAGSIFQSPRFMKYGLHRPLTGDTDGDVHRQAVSLDEEFVYRESPREQPQRVADDPEASRAK